MVKRKGFIIYFKSKKILKDIKKFHVNITYVNDKGNYAVGFVDDPYYESTKARLLQNKAIKKVEESLIDMDHLEFEE